jgi:hypothetical protein
MNHEKSHWLTRLAAAFFPWVLDAAAKWCTGRDPQRARLMQTPLEGSLQLMQRVMMLVVAIKVTISILGLWKAGELVWSLIRWLASFACLVAIVAGPVAADEIDQRPLRHVCYAPLTQLPAGMDRWLILDPNAWMSGNLDKAFAQLHAGQFDGVQADAEYKGELFKERFRFEVGRAYVRELDMRTVKACEVIRQLECEAAEISWRRSPRHEFSFWVSQHHQKTPAAIRKFNNLWSPDGKYPGVARVRAIADVEHFYDGRGIDRYLADPWPASVPPVYQGRCRLIVNINNHFGDGQPWDVDVYRAMIRYAKQNGFPEIGWCYFRNKHISDELHQVIGLGSFRTLELFAFRAAIEEDLEK